MFVKKNRSYINHTKCITSQHFLEVLCFFVDFTTISKPADHISDYSKVTIFYSKGSSENSGLMSAEENIINLDVQLNCKF